MDGHEEISERCLSAREISLQEKIVRLENQLQGYKSELDILQNQRQKLEERFFKMESALTKTKKELLEAKQEVLNKEIAETQLSEKLKSMTLKADEFERLFLAESSKNRCSLERLEKILSKEDTENAHEATQDKFEGLKEILNAVQEGFTAQVKVIRDKISEAENTFCGSLRGQTSNFTNSTHDDDGEDNAKDFHPDAKRLNPGLADQSKPIFESTPLTPKQTSLARSAKPRTQPSVKRPLKIQSRFFAGRSSNNSPERQVEHFEKPAMTPTSPWRVRNDSNTSYTNSGTLSTSQFTFSAINKSSPSPFTFGTPSSAASSTTSTFFGASPEAPITSKPTITQPSVLATFEIPAITTNSSQLSFAFGTSNPAGCSSFSSSKGQTELPSTKYQVTAINHLESSFSFSTSTQTAGVSKEKLFSQRPTGSFHFGKLDSIPPLGGASLGVANVNNFWRQLTPSTYEPSNSPIQKTQTQPSFSPGQDKGLTIPEKSAIVQPSGALPFRRILVAKSPVKGSKKQDEDCVLVYEIRASIADREKATRLLLPPNFFNYAKLDPRPGCIGCGVVSPETVESSQKENEENKEPEITPDTSQNGTGSGPGTFTGPVFGESASFGQLTFSSVFQGSTGFPQTQNKDTHKPFQGAGTQLFGDPTEEAEGQRDDQLYFEPVIPLPEEIKVVTGEEGLEVLFSERAKLYRFDADSGQWKERGIGEIKLLRHPSSGRGRVLMRREQIKKLCANHNITAGMELKPNVGSDRSWVWYTSADYAEGEARPEKLAIKLKTPEIAEKFKQIFNDLNKLSSSELPPETNKTEEKQATGCELYGQFISTFAPAPGAWSCEVCYVENKADDVTCVACNSANPGAQIVKPSLQTGEETETATNASVLESVELITFQGSNKPATPSGLVFQPAGGKWVSSGQLFTIGRVDPSEDTADDEIEISPRKFSSPTKQGVSPPQKPSTPSQGARLITQLRAGTPSKFTFSMVVSPGSPARQVKSPLSRASPVSPESPVHADDDGPHFEPIIPLPEKVECRTGDEGQEVLFCERCKLFRFDGDTSQWKERGIGDIKILRNSTSGKCRVLMRREQIFKLCANHMITAEMELRPFPKSDRAWLWTTLAEFSDEDAVAETLAARFRTSEIASRFKEEFDKVIQAIASKSNGNVSPTNPEIEKHVSDGQKERTKRLQVASNFFVCKQMTSESNPDRSKLTTSHDEDATQNKPNFLFGCASVASVSFQSVANLSLKETPFGKKTTDESTGFVGAGSLLFVASKADEHDRGDTAEGDHDGPHFEPIIPLPDKIDVKTGEEDEEVMFSHRAKLYRFVAEDKQWKDRGVGDIKLLRNNLTGKMRVLMRREQVLKLCANHQITTDMKLQPNAGSDRSWVWSTPADFSEEECRPERLAVRFKSEEIAKQFKEKFERCQEILKEQASLNLPTQEDTGQDRAVENDRLAKFKAAEGSWECDTCMLRNDRDKVKCAACGTVKPGAEISEQNEADQKPLFGSGVPSSGAGFLFGTGISFGTDGSGFSFGSTGTSVGSGKQLFSFGPAVSFGVARQSANTFGTPDGKQSTGEEVDRRKDDHTRNPEEGGNVEGSSKQFKEKFERCQEILKEQASLKLPTQEDTGQDRAVENDFLAKFKAAEGSWECDTCKLRNDRDKVKCAACGTVKPGVK